MSEVRQVPVFNPDDIPSDEEIAQIVFAALDEYDDRTIIENCNPDWLPAKYQLFVEREVQNPDENYEYYLKLLNGFVVANFWKNCYATKDLSWQVKVGAADIEPYDFSADVQKVVEWCINQFELGF